MRTFFILIFILGFGNTYSQKTKTENDSIVWTKLSCENGKKAAKIDFKNGIYNCFSYGLIFETNPSLSKFIDEYREKKYGIITRNAGCVITDYSKCYSKTMRKLVLKKFGSDIFERSRVEAEKLYSEKD
ncbi:hypothetical protein HKT18_13545 [Flavobacterium sp. IMCC34852]|uniref:Uncharacterized protein n=1 Tax=Flavobacterium rivulicola TaxID=2732161 RepID=A0A7Y3RB89_9FLAO|nr:hypothetical protein [Flavobacterium sp. IMCC34852]NNT73243.1 hypothetical protein [Flavobacterium sp. IMCC34852]